MKKHDRVKHNRLGNGTVVTYDNTTYSIAFVAVQYDDIETVICRPESELVLIDNESIQFRLSGDGMVNIHPGIDTTNTDYGKYYFAMNKIDFNSYLFNNEIHIDNSNIVDNEDGYIYGRINN